MNSLVVWLATASDSIVTGLNKTCGSSCNTSPIQTVFLNIANALTYIVGAVSVIMIIIGGLRYVLSQGDSKAAADGKNTILYSVIGVVVAIMAYAIIQFVTASFK